MMGKHIGGTQFILEKKVTEGVQLKRGDVRQ